MSDNTFEVKWRIENALTWFQTRNDTLYSPQFLAGTLKNTRWKLKLSPNSLLGEKYISFSLQRDIEDDYPQPINLNCELLFIASDGSLLESKKFTDKFDPKTVSHELHVKRSAILEEEKDVYFSKGTLTVCCQLWKGSAFSYGRSCLIQTVIGKKCVKVNTTIDDLVPPSIKMYMNKKKEKFIRVPNIKPDSHVSISPHKLMMKTKGYVYYFGVNSAEEV